MYGPLRTASRTFPTRNHQEHALREKPAFGIDQTVNDNQGHCHDDGGNDPDRMIFSFSRQRNIQYQERHIDKPHHHGCQHHQAGILGSIDSPVIVSGIVTLRHL